MFSIEDYLSGFSAALRGAFAERLLYIGLQGSYSRGEADEKTISTSWSFWIRSRYPIWTATGRSWSRRERPRGRAAFSAAGRSFPNGIPARSAISSIRPRTGTEAFRRSCRPIRTRTSGFLSKSALEICITRFVMDMSMHRERHFVLLCRTPIRTYFLSCKMCTIGRQASFSGRRRSFLWSCPLRTGKSWSRRRRCGAENRGIFRHRFRCCCNGAGISYVR